MKKTSKEGQTRTGLTIGIDLGDQWSRFCVLDGEGEITGEGRVRMTPAALRTQFEGYEATLIAIETGAQSGWVSRLLESLGHTVLVANAREVKAISGSHKKNDRVDAEKLARYARVDPSILCPIEHRSAELQQDLTVIRARALLVRMRTEAINSVRGLVKAEGQRVRKCSSAAFAKRCLSDIAPPLVDLLGPVLTQIGSLSLAITEYDRRIHQLADERYGEQTRRVQQVPGVGELTALTYVLTVGDAQRFRRSRDLGCYFGLRPRQYQSGERDPQLGISKRGDVAMRALLVQSAHYVMGPFGPDSDLRRWGLKLANRGGKNTKKRAIVAVARKLAVLLHRLWVTGNEYVPLREVAAAA